MASRLKHLALGSRPYINIVLENERDVYSTLDQLSGKVEIAVPTSTRFEDIEIQFIGMLIFRSLARHTKNGLTSLDRLYEDLFRKAFVLSRPFKRNVGIPSVPEAQTTNLRNKLSPT